MGKRFYSSHDQGLQNAYGAWAAALPVNCIVAITLREPRHAMAAFFGCAHVGRSACMAVGELDVRFVVLSDEKAPNDVAVLAGDDVPFITFTSGSTNRPKAILRGAQSWIYSFERNGVTADDCVAVIGNLAHSLPHYAACEAMHLGADILFCAKRLAGSPSVIYATPTQLRLVGSVFETVRLVMVGGGHFSAQDRVHCAIVFPNADLRIFYGTAETSFIAISDEYTPVGSVGQAYDGVEVCVLNREVSVNTPMMANRYLDKVKEFDRGVPFATGEFGWVDTQGYLFLDGRADRMVTITDKSVHLDAIEADLMALDGVTMAGVVALPDAKRGMCAVGAVMGKDVTHPLLAGVMVLNEWPQLLSGKTDYSRLREILMRAFT